MTTHPKKIIDAHCHIGEIPPWKFYDLEHPGEADGLRLQGHEGVPEEPHGGVQGRARARHVQLRRADPRAVVRPQRGRARGVDHQRPHPRRDLGLVPAAQRRDDAQGAQARRGVERRRAEDDVPARRQPRPGHVGRGDDRRSPTSASTSARSTTSSSTSTRARAATRTSATSSRSSRSTASAARSTSSTWAAACRATSSSCRSSSTGCEQGYKVYTDTSWAVGFGARWLLTEIERTRRRRRPRLLRLRRAVVGLRLGVLEAQRRPRDLAGAQGQRLLAQLREPLRQPWLTRASPTGARCRSTTAGCSSSCSPSACASSAATARSVGAAAPARPTRCSCTSAGCR